MSGLPESGQGWAICEYANLVRKSGSLAARSHQMPRPLRRRPKPDRRLALELLAGSPTGGTEALLFAHCVTIEQMVEVARAGLATVKPERMRAGVMAMEITRLRITAAGQQALAECAS
jgi:hypothetical protein